jgi:hypothetical protein
MFKKAIRILQSQDVAYHSLGNYIKGSEENNDENFYAQISFSCLMNE